MCFKVDCIDLYIIESLWQKSLQLRVLFSNGDDNNDDDSNDDDDDDNNNNNNHNHNNSLFEKWHWLLDMASKLMQLHQTKTIMAKYLNVV